MITIHDNRRTNDIKLLYIEINGFFVYGDVLCRRIAISDDFNVTADGIPYMEMPSGKAALMDKDTWVTPIRDEHINVSIEDWG